MSYKNQQSNSSLSSSFSAIKSKISVAWQRLLVQIEKRPFGSFLFVLAALVVVAAVGSAWRKPELQAEEVPPPPLVVPILSVGEQPIVSVPATVQTSGVIKVSAQSGGIVQKLPVKPGQRVYRGQQLASLSVGYAGGSAQSLQRQIADKSYTASKDNISLQLELIAKRRQIAENSETLAAELRSISRASIDDTKGMISLNEEILSTIEDQLITLEQTNVGGVNDSTIQSLKGTKSSVLSGLNALRAGLRVTEYQSNEDQEPAIVARVSRDLTVKQLDLEERGIKLGLEIAELNLKLARFSESLLYPATPCAGVVERIYVRFGQSINPGTPVAEVVCDKTGNQVIGLTSETVARKLMQSSDGTYRTVDGATVSAQVLAVSTQPTDGPLYSVTAVLVEEAVVPSDGTHGVLELPTTGLQTSGSIPFIPLDAIYQTQSQSFVYVVVDRDGKRFAELREVELGAVFNTSVEVLSGLSTGDSVILSRAVSAGSEIVIEE